MVNCPMVNGIPGIRLKTYGGEEIGEEPKFARMESDVPKAMKKSVITKQMYLRNNSFGPLLT
jgi:hypothetical protein